MIRFVLFWSAFFCATAHVVHAKPPSKTPIFTGRHVDEKRILGPLLLPASWKIIDPDDPSQTHEVGGPVVGGFHSIVIPTDSGYVAARDPAKLRGGYLVIEHPETKDTGAQKLEEHLRADVCTGSPKVTERRRVRVTWADSPAHKIVATCQMPTGVMLVLLYQSTTPDGRHQRIEYVLPTTEASWRARVEEIERRDGTKLP